MLSWYWMVGKVLTPWIKDSMLQSPQLQYFKPQSKAGISDVFDATSNVRRGLHEKVVKAAQTLRL